MSRSLLLVGSLIAVACDAPQPAFKEKITGEWVDTADGADIEQRPAPSSPKTFMKTWAFKADKKEGVSIGIEASQDYLDAEIVMEDFLVDASEQRRQVQRRQHTETFNGGADAKDMQETFVQEESSQGQLDILELSITQALWEEQNNLAEKLSPLITYVEKSDWQNAVVTTDPDDGCLRSLITRADKDPLTAFSKAIRAGTDGSGNERGIQQAVRSLRMDCAGQKPWLREASSVAVIIVSDEDNCSDTSMCNGKAWQSSEYLTDYLSSIRKLGEDARVYGIFWDPNEPSWSCSSAHEKVIYQSRSSGGSWDPSVAPITSNLAQTSRY